MIRKSMSLKHEPASEPRDTKVYEPLQPRQLHQLWRNLRRARIYSSQTCVSLNSGRKGLVAASASPALEEPASRHKHYVIILYYI